MNLKQMVKWLKIRMDFFFFNPEAYMLGKLFISKNKIFIYINNMEEFVCLSSIDY